MLRVILHGGKFHFVCILGIVVDGVAVFQCIHADDITGLVIAFLIITEVHPIIPFLDGFYEEINPLIFSVKDDFTETHFRRIAHDFRGNIHPHIVTDEGFIQKWAMECPVAFFAHTQKGQISIDKSLRILHQLHTIALFIEIAGGVASDTNHDVAFHVRRICGMMVLLFITHDRQFAGNHGASIGCGCEADFLMMFIGDGIAGDCHAAGINDQQRQMGASQSHPASG